MAAAEVNVSSGDLMTVREEEEESSGNNHKTEVIVHLQPILHGINDDTAETGTTVLAIEAHHENSRAEGEEVEYGYPITCGDSRAVLLFKKFVCPGINVRCVKFNDQLISPKQFVHLAGKATLKDWKRAIRLGGVMLRKMMDSGQIDFYQHDTVCGNTCRSTKFDVLINSTRLPPGTSVQPGPPCLALDLVGGRVPPLTVISGEVEENLEKKLSATAEWSPYPTRHVNPTPANGYGAKRKRSDPPDGVLSLWKGVVDSGLMGEVLSSLQTELLATLKGVEVRSEKANLQETDAVILNSLCKMFGLLDSVKRALDLKRSLEEGKQTHNNVYVSDEILQQQKRQTRDESRSHKPQSSKHLRLQRHNCSHSQTHNLLSPVKSSAGIHPLSAAGLSSFAHLMLPLNPQLLGHFSASAVHNAKLQMEHEISETGNQEKLRRLVQYGVDAEDVLDIHQELARRTARHQGDPRLRSERVKETEGACVINKGSKKHKSK
ncbi:glucocorticoid modulatory element-binding protein 1-like [Pungitius pungitius]|uniref:glucocorticoid modulatory element-binding protein 1-like n=1 Tax=Pungitius pungitius TaxID=134920 RepID=UPI002E15E786